MPADRHAGLGQGPRQLARRWCRACRPTVSSEPMLKQLRGTGSDVGEGGLDMTGSVTALRGGRGRAAVGRHPGRCYHRGPAPVPTGGQPRPAPEHDPGRPRFHPARSQAARPSRPDRGDPRRRARPGHGPHRAGQGRGRGHRRRDRQGRGLRRHRDRASSCSRSSSLVVGGSLFLAEWLLGSIGWGVLHGVLLFISIAIACVAGGGRDERTPDRPSSPGRRDRRRRHRRADPGLRRS